MPQLKSNGLSDLNLTKLTGVNLKKQIEEMLMRSSQCKAILETVNHDTGEYRIVLQGILDIHQNSSF